MGYVIEKLLANRANYTPGRSRKAIRFIFIHYTGSSASARNNALYFSRSVAHASAHYFIDGSGTIFQSVEDKDTAWAVGNYDINQRSISIEVVSAGKEFTQPEKQELRWLVLRLMKKYNVDKSCILRHYDASSVATIGKTLDAKKRCPAPYIDNERWLSLRRYITTEDADTESYTAPTPNPKTAKVEEDGYLGKNSIYALQRLLNISKPDGIITGQHIMWSDNLKAITSIKYNYGKGGLGSETVRRMQRLVKVKADGVLGQDSIKAWQTFVGSPSDGYFGRNTARATQRWINDSCNS